MIMTDTNTVTEEVVLEATVKAIEKVKPEIEGGAAFDALQEILDDVKGDFNKAYIKGQNAAIVRIRAAMQKLKSEAQNIRKESLVLRDENKEARAAKKVANESAE